MMFKRREMVAQGIMALASALWPSAVLAHRSTRQKVEETAEIKAPPEKVWAVIGNFQDMSWLLLVASITGYDGNTPDKAMRTLTLKNGGVFKESLYKFDAASMM